MTGSTDGLSYHWSGTVPTARCPGLAYLGTVCSTVASEAPPRAAGRRWAACPADAARGVPAGPPTDVSTSPADVTRTATPVTPTAIAVRDALIRRFVGAVSSDTENDRPPPSLQDSYTW
jgi:hypothetical protein